MHASQKGLQIIFTGALLSGSSVTQEEWDEACLTGMVCSGQGPSAKEARRDTTTFEAARAEWSKATLSIKGSVGATGDHRSEVWLG